MEETKAGGGGDNLCSEDDSGEETFPSTHRDPNPGRGKPHLSQIADLSFILLREKLKLSGLGLRFKGPIRSPPPFPPASTTKKGKKRGLGSGQRNNAVLPSRFSCVVFPSYLHILEIINC